MKTLGVSASVNARADLGRSSALIQFCAKFNFQYHRYHHPAQVYLYKVFSFFLCRSSFYL